VKKQNENPFPVKQTKTVFFVYDGSHILAAFSTIEDAEKTRDWYASLTKDLQYLIASVEVDPPLPAEKDWAEIKRAFDQAHKARPGASFTREAPRRSL
jgi:hypothetical protein